MKDEKRKIADVLAVFKQKGIVYFDEIDRMLDVVWSPFARNLSWQRAVEAKCETYEETLQEYCRQRILLNKR